METGISATATGTRGAEAAGGRVSAHTSKDAAQHPAAAKHPTSSIDCMARHCASESSKHAVAASTLHVTPAGFVHAGNPVHVLGTPAFEFAKDSQHPAVWKQSRMVSSYRSLNCAHSSFSPPGRHAASAL
eukprot:2537076-Rhodomonas_salina.2